MQLNTTSGLTPALDAIGALLQAKQQNDAQMQGLSRAGIAGLTQADAPQGGILASLGLGGSAPRAPAAPVVAPPSQATPAAAPGPISPNAQTALAYFQDKGLSPVAAQGLVGNFMRESGGRLDPNATNPSGGAFGIAQWLSPDRIQGLRSFAASSGRSVGDLQTQLDYVWNELNGPEKATLAALKSATNPLQAAVAGVGYERPEGWSAGNPTAAKDFGKRLAATVGLGGAGPSAMAYAPQQSGPAMPLATADRATPPSAPPASPPAQPASGGIPNQAQIQELLRNPATRDLGLKLWQQSITPKDGFTLKPGEAHFDARGQQIAALPDAPKFEHTELNGRALAFDPKHGTYADQTPAGLPQGFRPATAEERTKFGVGPTTPFFFGPDGKPATLQGGTQVTVNNAVNPILKGMGDQFVEGAQGARDAADGIRSIQNARAQFQGGIIAGFGADQQVQLQKLGAALGLVNPDKIVNTETFLTQMKPLVLSTVKGLGAGSGISNADRDFALQAVGGSNKSEPQTIGRVLDITERMLRAKIDRHNALADQMIAKQPELGQVGPMLRIQPPPAAATQPAPQPVVQDMSPLGQAKAAIAAGAPREAVIQRLQQHGVDTSGL